METPIESDENTIILHLHYFNEDEITESSVAVCGHKVKDRDPSKTYRLVGYCSTCHMILKRVN